MQDKSIFEVTKKLPFSKHLVVSLYEDTAPFGIMVDFLPCSRTHPGFFFTLTLLGFAFHFEVFGGSTPYWKNK